MFTRTSPNSKGKVARLSLDDDANLRTIAADDADVVTPMIGFVLKFQLKRQWPWFGQDELRPTSRPVANDAVDEPSAIARPQDTSPKPRP